MVRTVSAARSWIIKNKFKGEFSRTGSVNGHHQAAFQEAWFRAATNQKFDASLAATLPRHDADDIMAELNSECNNLYKLAKQSDVEIA